tara:strand:- start:200 stop:496 length:297 start_codon:yes stop_codon:yes gene_type:complete
MTDVQVMKSTLRKIVLDQDEEYYEEGNVVYAKNAFLVNSVLSWYFNERDAEKLNVRHIGSVIDLLDKHIRKELVLAWGGDGLKILDVNQKTKQRKNES